MKSKIPTANKRTRSYAFTLYYLYLISNGIPTTQKEIAELGGISPAMIRKRYKELRGIFFP